MKKILASLLTILLLLAGLFLWKGGHHALSMASELARWAEEDASDQKFQLTLDDITIEGSSFWMDRSGDRVYGITVDEFTLWLRNSVVYTDTGKAYSLPSPEADPQALLWSALLKGRITREDSLRQLTLEQDSVQMTGTMDDFGNITLDVQWGQESDAHHLSVSLQRRDTQAHTIPQNVLDAMVRADMEPPISILEPLEAVGPALAALTQMEADVTLAVECGIINLSEQLELTAGPDGLVLKRSGVEIQLPLNRTLDASAAPELVLLFLRNGDFMRTDTGAQLSLQIPGDSITGMMEAMIPQISGMGVSYDDATVSLFISGDQLETVSMEAGGSVPFLITEIPIRITVNCQVK